MKLRARRRRAGLVCFITSPTRLVFPGGFDFRPVKVENALDEKKPRLASGFCKTRCGLLGRVKQGKAMIQAISGGGQSVIVDTAATRLFRLKKGVMTTARLVNDRLRGAPVRWVPLMLTLTYADKDAWRPDHISAFIDRLNKYGKRRGVKFPYVWVAELQKRGAVHYHVLVWIPARLRVPKPDRQGWWHHGSTNVKRVRNAVGYVAKYASKLESKGGKFPKGLRLHGIGGLIDHERNVVAWWKLPKDLRQGAEGSCRWRRAVGGGWVNPDTRVRLLPQWDIQRIGAGRYVHVAPTTKSREERTYLTYVREHHATIKAQRDYSPMLLCDTWDRDQEYAAQIREAYADRLWRECQTRQEQWRAQLTADRAQWLAAVTVAHGLSDDEKTSRAEQRLASRLEADREVLLRLSALRAATETP